MNDVIARAVVFGFVILTIVIKPEGLFSYKGAGAMKKLSKESLIDIAFYAVFIIAILIAPRFLEEFGLNRLAKFLVYGMLGIGWLFRGDMQASSIFGQGLFFGLGAYMIAMSLKLASPTSLQQDRISRFPIHAVERRAGIEDGSLCIKCGLVSLDSVQASMVRNGDGRRLPTIIAFLVGSVIFRKKIAGVFISVITLSLVLLVRLLIIDAQPLTNGWNGLTTSARWHWDPSSSIRSASRPTIWSAFRLRSSSVAIKLLTQTRAGMVLQAIRTIRTASCISARRCRCTRSPQHHAGPGLRQQLDGNEDDRKRNADQIVGLDAERIELDGSSAIVPRSVSPFQPL